MADQEPEHDHCHHPQGGPDSWSSGFANLRGTGLPWREVLRIAAANMKLKVMSRRACCGNPGQPGC